MNIKQLIIIALSFSILSSCGKDEPHDHDMHMHETNDNKQYDTYVDRMSKVSGNITVTLTNIPGPPGVGINNATISITAPIPSGGHTHMSLVSGTSITFEAFMPNHGHGTAQLPIIAETSDGIFDISNIVLMMPGIWEYRITVKDNNGIEENVVFVFMLD
tara:strand:+ start:60 stop:539 length:480 start_codon:yes stop_codon:yes gene_type:complete